jgi:hypothetical protein
MVKKSVYIETTIPSILTARPGRAFLPTNKDTEDLAEEYFKYLNVPKKAKTDCFHLAICVVEKINYLVSWNMTHLGRPAANRVAIFNGTRNLWLPDLVTPDLLMDIEKEEAQNEV